MQTLLHIATRKKFTAAERKAAADKAEREFDKRVLARLKRRAPTSVADAAPWSRVKKNLGLSRQASQGCRAAIRQTRSAGTTQNRRFDRPAGLVG